MLLISNISLNFNLKPGKDLDFSVNYKQGSQGNKNMCWEKSEEKTEGEGGKGKRGKKEGKRRGKREKRKKRGN